MLLVSGCRLFAWLECVPQSGWSPWHGLWLCVAKSHPSCTLGARYSAQALVGVLARCRRGWRVGFAIASVCISACYQWFQCFMVCCCLYAIADEYMLFVIFIVSSATFNSGNACAVEAIHLYVSKSFVHAITEKVVNRFGWNFMVGMNYLWHLASRKRVQEGTTNFGHLSLVPIPFDLEQPTLAWNYM